MTRTNDLGRDALLPLVLRLAVPTMLAQFVSVLYSIVDRIFIGNIPEIGSIALAGVEVCGPIVTLISSFATLVGLGGSPHVAMRMGAGDRAGAHQLLANCFLLLAGLAAALTALFLLFREPLLMLFGASAQSFPYANTYMTIYTAGSFFAMMAAGMNSFLICQGRSGLGMGTVAVGAVMNIALDPIFIFGFGWGVAGAAWATVLSQAASCVFVLAMLRHRSMPIRLEPDKLSPALMGKVLLFGLTPFLTISLDSVILIVLNAVLQSRGGPGTGDTLVSCNTIVQSYMLLITMPMGGITGGCQPIVSYNYGAGNTARIRKAIRYVLLLCLAFTAGMTVITFTLSPLFVRLFTSDQALVPLTVKYIRRFCLCAVPLAAQYTAVDMSTALGRVRHSLFCSVNRKVWFTALTLALPALLGAADAAFWAEPIVDLGCAAITSCLVFTTLPDFLRRRELEQTLS